MNCLLRSAAPVAHRSVARLLVARYSTQTGTKERIDEIVNKEKIVVFMKGTPAQPMCGFSNAVMQILNFHGVDKFDTYNVLEDEEIRQGIKEYSNWPTIPQVYFSGEFMGGCDIMLDLHKNGELIEELEKLGIRSALLDNPDKKA